MFGQFALSLSRSNVIKRLAACRLEKCFECSSPVDFLTNMPRCNANYNATIIVIKFPLLHLPTFYNFLYFYTMI